MADWRQRHQVVPAVYVLLERNGQVLFMRRANTGYRDGEYSLPAGHLDGGEPAAVAAAREVKEEAGVDINPQDLELIHTQHRMAEEGDHERICLYFKTTRWKGEPYNAEPDKCDDLCWKQWDEPPKPLVPELQELQKQLLKQRSYGHFGFREN